MVVFRALPSDTSDPDGEVDTQGSKRNRIRRHGASVLAKVLPSRITIAQRGVGRNHGGQPQPRELEIEHSSGRSKTDHHSEGTFLSDEARGTSGQRNHGSHQSDGVQGIGTFLQQTDKYVNELLVFLI